MSQLDRARSDLYRRSLHALDDPTVCIKAHHGAQRAAWAMDLPRWWKSRLKEPWRRYRLLELGLLAAVTGTHVVIADHPVERSREARDAIIGALKNLGFDDEATNRLHAWPPNALWFAWSQVNGHQAPSAERNDRSKTRKIERARQRTIAEVRAGELDWMKGTHVFKLPIEDDQKTASSPRKGRGPGHGGRQRRNGGRRPEPVMPEVIRRRR